MLIPGCCISLVLFLCCSACSVSRVKVEQGPAGSVHGVVIAGIPFYPQEDYQCGPASLASVMNFRGVPVAPARIAEDIYSKTAKGTLTIDMVLYAQAKGLKASFYRGGLDDLRGRIDSGHPLVVLVDYGVSVYQASHFMVVIGYRDDGVIVNSGRQEQKFIPNDEFLKVWEKAKFWTLLIEAKEK